MQQINRVKLYSGYRLSQCANAEQHTGVSVYKCSSLQFLPLVITINDSVHLLKQPG